MKYLHPPITEAVVEVHFAGPPPADDVGSAFHDAWRPRVRKREQIQIQRIHVSIGTPARQPQEAPPAPTDRLWMDDPWGVVQVGPGFLSVHMLRQATPYPGYEKFIPLIREAVGQYVALAAPEGISQVAVRYLNHLEIPIGADGTPADWLDVGVWLPDILDEHLVRLSVQAVARLPRVGAQLHFGITDGEAVPDHVSLILDLKVVSLAGQAPSLDALERWLDLAHQDGIISPFEGSITDAARAAFVIVEDDRD